MCLWSLLGKYVALTNYAALLERFFLTCYHVEAEVNFVLESCPLRENMDFQPVLIKTQIFGFPLKYCTTTGFSFYRL